MGAIFCNEGIVFIIIGIIGIIDGFRLTRISLVAKDAFGPGWYLIILSFVMVISGVFCLTYSLKNINKKTEALRFRLGPASIAFAIMLIYSVVVSYIGYFVSTAAFLLVTIRLFGEQSWVKSTLIAGVSAVAFWFFFVFIAGIPMP